MSGQNKLFGAGVIAGLLLSSSAIAMADSQTFSISEPEGGAQTHVGELRIDEDEGLTVREMVFRNMDGDVVQTERVVYDPNTLRITEYSKVNTPVGLEEYIESGDEQFTMRRRAKASKDFEEDRFDWSANEFHPAVLDALTRTHWEEIRDGGYEFEMFVGQLGKSLDMELVHDGEQTLDGERVSIIKLQPTSWVMRKLMPDNAYYYRTEPEPRLVRYVGPSHFPATEQVDIRYAQTAEH
ncbi:hypothetical protein [uncultured Abyssibacter sp.]|uniref:hypothetical protein n=1 Tax=uncultured Abyssibacter sp. TaxID=2320202 RepID=UPI0032B2C3CB